MNTAYIILGGNIEDRLDYIKNGIELISLRVGEIHNKSSIYESEPWGFDASINFLNQVVEIRTDLSAQDLLKQLLAIEIELGRERKESGYASRTIDLDILFYNNEIIYIEKLIIPHPRLHKRIFTLKPLCEIAPNLIHPVLKKTIKTLLDGCEDDSIVNKLD